jgi:hypothetical protein
MLRLADLPMIPSTWINKADREKADMARWRALNREGYTARKAGILKCPPFVDPDMAIYWDVGWREADREMTERNVRRRAR